MNGNCYQKIPHGHSVVAWLVQIPVREYMIFFVVSTKQQYHLRD